MSIFSDRLVESREKKNISQKKLAELLEITPTRLNYWEKGKREPDIAMIKKISEILTVSPDYLIGNDTFIEKNNTNEYIRKYYQLDNIAKSTVNNVINFEYKQSQKRKTMSEYTVEAAREIKLFDLAASAGTGNYLTDSDYTFIGVGNDVPKSADFAIRVSGDSMEPKYHDKQIVYVKSQPDIENGQVGIFFLNGESYIKRFEKRSDGSYLVSFNSNYEPIELKEWDEFKCFGCVLN